MAYKLLIYFPFNPFKESHLSKNISVINTDYVNVSTDKFSNYKKLQFNI